MEDKICRDCGLGFTNKIMKSGFINQCDDCTEDESHKKYLGFNDGSLNKSTHTSIYRGNNSKIRNSIQNQKSRVGGI